ncbi:hypothetical protein B7C42_01746 [Nocardia cerradoensis]|uniref:Uncharacterized protein n=1 Tax=Nocardia cerradoensis TaxID=85688 RepID=A0A231HDE4_9NOCA|nr:hypothetical protein B7C42_01746 [Nocardia cerradoensis]
MSTLTELLKTRENDGDCKTRSAEYDQAVTSGELRLTLAQHREEKQLRTFVNRLVDIRVARLRALGSRAEKAGYRLVRERALPGAWTLLDAEDGEIIHAATPLDYIEQWLDE